MTQLQLARFEKWWTEHCKITQDGDEKIGKDAALKLWYKAIQPEVKWNEASEIPKNGTYMVYIKNTLESEIKFMAIRPYTYAWTLTKGDQVLFWAELPIDPEVALPQSASE